jgi:hypothetical protein
MEKQEEHHLKSVQVGNLMPPDSLSNEVAP